ncbi:hypothetical protein HNQ77_002964 [Silvibacterium bohemicum]|uniref:Uncharacterized protein n=1 Tax=Silvibacterium bohemicum TaxID=1577686 RepID=A0A841K2Z9_9BACT|nr:flagellar biosynthetic protein FliO [Silvibacterium bohemicum]MBB6145008.1 hypothetical protein [Silvibacterium bohemicum]
MSAKNRKRRSSAPASRPRMSSPMPQFATAGASFRASLSQIAQSHSVLQWPRLQIAPDFLARFKQQQQPLVNTVTRVWAWLHKKYTVTTNKRLRVAETVSLGEKRFVALITIEGREFLIGGGTAGVSLLAQLGAGQETANASALRIEGISE